jgi:hypothetical protein
VVVAVVVAVAVASSWSVSTTLCSQYIGSKFAFANRQ